MHTPRRGHPAAGRRQKTIMRQAGARRQQKTLGIHVLTCFAVTKLAGIALASRGLYDWGVAMKSTFRCAAAGQNPLLTEPAICWTRPAARVDGSNHARQFQSRSTG
jgi:hypothetical protein